MDTAGGLGSVEARPARARPRPWISDRLFFGSMSALIAVTVFAGFYRTYFLRTWLEIPAGVMPMTSLVHLHGALFSGWIVLLIAQTTLVARGRTDIHRKLGVIGACMAALMVVVGTLTALLGAARGSGPPGVAPLPFLAIPLFDLVVFSILVAAGIRARRDPQTHKRLLLLATIGILPAAIARWPLGIMQAGPIAFFGIDDLYILPLVGFDLATRGRVHKATLWGGLVILISQPLRLAISGTDAWLRFASWAVSLVS